MRMFVLLASTAMLAACGGSGGGVSSLGSSAVVPSTATPTPTATATPTPSATATPAPTATPTPTPTAVVPPTPPPVVIVPTPTPTATPTPAANGPSVAIAPSVAPNATSMIDVKVATSFAAVGGVQSLTTTGVRGADGKLVPTSTLYAGNASTPATSSGTITFDPRDGIFTMALNDGKAIVTRDNRFQDPAHRTDFAGARAPDATIINLPGYNYMNVLDGDGVTAFFYQRPGTKTFYVTLGGFLHYTIPTTSTTTMVDERGAFVFGAPTAGTQLPRTGTGSFAGDFLAAMVAKDSDARVPQPSRLQWINGETAINVDFGSSQVALAFTGRVSPALADGALVADSQLLVPSGSIFSAIGSASFDAVAQAFAGRFSSAGFTANGVTTPIDFASIAPGSSTAGASSIDGSFYGPDAVEIGGSFRIVGGIPDQRVDILGGFTGRKK